jgi:hypothetical protein
MPTRRFGDEFHVCLRAAIVFPIIHLSEIIFFVAELRYFLDRKLWYVVQVLRFVGIIKLFIFIDIIKIDVLLGCGTV